MYNFKRSKKGDVCVCVGGGSSDANKCGSQMPHCKVAVGSCSLTISLFFWEQQQQQQQQQRCREGRRFRICNQAPVPPCSWRTGWVCAALGVCCLWQGKIVTVVLMWSCAAPRHTPTCCKPLTNKPRHCVVTAPLAHWPTCPTWPNNDQ